MGITLILMCTMVWAKLPKGLIAELDVRFLEQSILDAMGIVLVASRC